MGQENEKPNVFNKISEEDKKLINTENYDKIDEIKLQYSSDGELKHSMIMKENSERQLKARMEGEKLGLYGKELKEYIINKTPDISKRPELSEVKPKGSITYNNAEIETPKTIKQVNIDENGHVTGVVSTDILDLIKSKEEELIKEENLEIKALEEKMERWFEKMSNPQHDAPFDFVPVPSQGKQYGLKDKHIKMALLNGSDEDVLTNPNIVKSGRFLEVLFSRKILSDIKYEDLIPADRDALMIWLRGTAYGSDYPIEVTDPKDESVFEVTLDLSELPVSYLKLDTNKNDFFEYTTSMKNIIEFKFLTVGDIARLEERILKGYDSHGELYTESSIEFLCEIVQSFNGITDKETIKKKLKYLPLKEVNEFKRYMAENDFGIDFNLNITTPGGESITTPFPFNRNFFWSEF